MKDLAFVISAMLAGGVIGLILCIGVAVWYSRHMDKLSEQEIEYEQEFAEKDK